jgi:hypothetical protein
VLRHASEDHVLWIDALAINQSDIPERNAQVPKMPLIYSTASTTLVWLGSSDDRDISIGLALAEQIYEQERTVGEAAIEHMPHGVLIKVVGCLLPVVMLEYWNRVWIVQEIMYSQSAFLVTNDWAIPYSHFFEIQLRVRDSVNKLQRSISRNKTRYLIAGLEIALTYAGPLSLPKLGTAHLGDHLDSFQLQKLASSKNATDPRDNIFGFHGCLYPDFRRLMNINYSQSLLQVLTQTTKALLKEAVVLDSILTGKTWENVTLAPSWVWIPTIGTMYSQLQVDRPPEPDKWQAAGKLPLFYDLIDRDTVLHVKGKSVFTVETIAPPMHLPDTDLKELMVKDDVNAITSHLRQVLQLFNVPLGYIWFVPFNSAFHSEFVAYNRMRCWIRGGRLPVFFRRLSDWLFKASYDRASAVHTNILHYRKRMFTCKAGAAITYGLGPLEIIAGDKICVVQGCSVPLVFRQVEDHHILIGQAYVAVLMTGLAVRGIEAEEEEAEDFFLR